MYSTTNFYMSDRVSGGLPWASSTTTLKNPYHLSLLRSQSPSKQKHATKFGTQTKLKSTLNGKIRSKSKSRSKVKSKRKQYGYDNMTKTVYTARTTNSNHIGKHTPSKRGKHKANVKPKRVLSAHSSRATLSKTHGVSSTHSLQVSSMALKPNLKANFNSTYTNVNTNHVSHDDFLSPLSNLLNQFKFYENESKESKISTLSNTLQPKHHKYDNYNINMTNITTQVSPLSKVLSKYSNINNINSQQESLSKHRSNRRNVHDRHHRHGMRKVKPAIIEKTSMISTHVNNKIDSNANMTSNNHNSNHVRSKSDPWNVGTLNLNDIKMKALLGEGAFSKVYLVKFKQTKKVIQQIHYKLQNKNLALKMVDKKVKKNQTGLEWERFALSNIHHPFIVRYFGSFVDESRLCILTEFVIGGEILYHFENSENGRFDNTTTQFYIAEIMCALQYLHKKKYVYRDLKPENILIDHKGHAKLVDFGFAKVLNNNQRTYTLCGSKEYVAPEVLTGNGHSFEADFWSLGVLTYEFIVGHLPFPTQECDPYQVLPIIQSTKIDFPKYVDSNCADFIKKLLIIDPLNRETNFENLKYHSWFANDYFDWELCNTKKLKPPIIPKYKGIDDASNYATARFDTNSHTHPDGLIHF